MVEFSAGTETSAGGGPLSGTAFSPPSQLPTGPQTAPAPSAAPGPPLSPAAPAAGGTLVPFGGVQPYSQ